MNVRTVDDHRAEGLLRATRGYVPGKDVKGRYLVSRMNITGFYIVVMMLLGFMAILFIFAQFSGILRWIIVLLFISSAGFGIAFVVSRKTSSPERLFPSPDQEKKPWNEITRLTGIMTRAEMNYTYSQLEAVERIRRAVIDKIQTQRDISDDEMELLIHDRGKIVSLVEDEELADFLLFSERDLSSWVTVVREKLPVLGPFRGPRTFSQSIHPILKRMEDWE